MPSKSLAEIETNLRRAVACRCFAEVEQLTAAFCQAAAAGARTLPPGDPEIRHIVHHVEEVLDWAHLMLSTARAYAAAELAQVNRLSRYLDRARTNVPAVRLDA